MSRTHKNKKMKDTHASQGGTSCHPGDAPVHNIPQMFVLHDWDSSVVGHAAPPLRGGTRMARVRDSDPPPHDTEQVLHEPQKPTKQSTTASASAERHIDIDRSNQCAAMCVHTQCTRTCIHSPSTTPRYRLCHCAFVALPMQNTRNILRAEHTAPGPQAREAQYDRTAHRQAQAAHSRSHQTAVSHTRTRTQVHSQERPRKRAHSTTQTPATHKHNAKRPHNYTHAGTYTHTRCRAARDVFVL